MLFDCLHQLCFFYSLSSPNIPCKIQGEQDIEGKEIFDFIAHLYFWGHVYINRVLSTHFIHVIPVLVLLWFFFLLWLVDVSMLSNLVYSGPFPSKPTQDHKVSICITVMCMRISCCCTYCLQEGLMNMKIHFLYLHHLL